MGHVGGGSHEYQVTTTGQTPIQPRRLGVPARERRDANVQSQYELRAFPGERGQVFEAMHAAGT